VQRQAVAAVALLVLTVAGLLIFTGHDHRHEADVKPWKAVLSERGPYEKLSYSHWNLYQAGFKRECGLSFEALGILLTMRGDPGGQTAEKIGFKYQCPDQLSKLENAYRSLPVPHAMETLAAVCSTPAEERSDVQRELAALWRMC
jgi:hypothetical protein